MARRISAHEAAGAQALLDQGWPQRAVSDATGISRFTVWKIANGQWSAKRSPIERESMRGGPFVRCRTCGGLAQMPCRLCDVRALKEQAKQQPRRTQ
jgi:hypothetical protein